MLLASSIVCHMWGVLVWLGLDKVLKNGEVFVKRRDFDHNFGGSGGADGDFGSRH